jgi:DNA topoisomerase-1
MADAIFDTITVNILAERMLFRSTGRVLKFPGFLKVLSEYETGQSKDMFLPSLNENDVLNLVRCIPEQHFTEPPPQFTEASLIKELEKNGIGRPSTYAPIVSTIVNRRYVHLENHKFSPTELGIIVNDILNQHFKEIVDIHFTAHIEEKLDSIAHGNTTWAKVIGKFYKPFDKKLKAAKEKIVKRKMYKETDEKCPECGAIMYLRESRYGKFLSCSQWPKCKSKIPLDRSGNRKVVELTGEKCPECGKDLLKRSGRKGLFIACSGYPECKFTKNA